ncbi:MAG: hypothetical protein RLZZ271_643, partial [Pseudomonadota bacterium]
MNPIDTQPGEPDEQDDIEPQGIDIDAALAQLGAAKPAADIAS